MVMITDDPIADFNRYDAERQRELQKYPECDDCGIHITGDYYYEVDGTILCEECLEDRYRKYTDDYVENN